MTKITSGIHNGSYFVARSYFHDDEPLIYYSIDGTYYDGRCFDSTPTSGEAYDVYDDSPGGCRIVKSGETANTIFYENEQEEKEVECVQKSL